MQKYKLGKEAQQWLVRQEMLYQIASCSIKEKKEKEKEKMECPSKEA